MTFDEKVISIHYGCWISELEQVKELDLYSQQPCVTAIYLSEANRA